MLGYAQKHFFLIFSDSTHCSPRPSLRIPHRNSGSWQIRRILPLYAASARFNSSFASTSRWFVGSSSKQNVRLAVDQLTQAHLCLLATAEARAPGSRCAWSSDRILPVRNAPDTGCKTEILSRSHRCRSSYCPAPSPARNSRWRDNRPASTLPDTAGIKPRILFKSVVFPIPLAPTIAIFSPRSM